MFIAFQTNNKGAKLLWSLVIFFSGFWLFQSNDELGSAEGFVLLISMGSILGLYVLSYGLSLLKTKKDWNNLKINSFNAAFELAIFFTAYNIFAPIFVSFFGILSLGWKPVIDFILTLGHLVTLTISVFVHRMAFEKNKSTLYRVNYFKGGYIVVILLLIIFTLSNGY